VVAVPTGQHVEVGIRLAQAGMPALVEKPLAPDLMAAARLVDAFEMRGLIGAVGHIERYNAALQSLRRRLEAGSSVRSTRSRPGDKARSRPASPTSAW
jgi:predicted dehydrogenase